MHTLGDMSTTTAKVLEGSENTTPESPGICAMRLTVRNWLSHERSFQLDPYSNLEPLDSDFDYQIDWVMDLVEFSFKLPHDYPDTREGLLRKTQQLIQGANILGMRTTYTGESEVTMVKQDLKRKIHPRNLKKCRNRKSYSFGCNLNWIRRAGLCYLQFEVDSEDHLIVTVDENDAEYQGTGLDPVRALGPLFQRLTTNF
ncbi:hypothetical protein N7481_005555 [Penicillium waksmanii]|uniref:uncharacterized protein n=1 Tax=Penicillium waksmanii TaxID=69791 RepID=UPI00254900E0|nr:uncharacterized protein N7481_005555 [Penicillium waksmanii]KAJ5983456.1 hypothetical protein N7481_005555 [Penicillium waksmanii]